MLLEKRTLRKLKNKLPKNYTSILAERCNCSTFNVMNVIHGRRNDNFNVIEKAIELVKETRQKASQLTDEIEDLYNIALKKSNL